MFYSEQSLSQTLSQSLTQSLSQSLSQSLIQSLSQSFSHSLSQSLWKFLSEIPQWNPSVKSLSEILRWDPQWNPSAKFRWGNSLGDLTGEFHLGIDWGFHRKISRGGGISPPGDFWSVSMDLTHDPAISCSFPLLIDSYIHLQLQAVGIVLVYFN